MSTEKKPLWEKLLAWVPVAAIAVTTVYGWASSTFELQSHEARLTAIETLLNREAFTEHAKWVKDVEWQLKILCNDASANARSFCDR